MSDELDILASGIKRSACVPDRWWRAAGDAAAQSHETEPMQHAANVAQSLAFLFGGEMADTLDVLAAQGSRPMVLVHRGDAAAGIPTLWLLGWSTAEGTDIHDHIDSAAGIAVLRGQVIDRAYAFDPMSHAQEVAHAKNGGLHVRVTDRNLRAGSTVSIPSPYIHVMVGTTDNTAQRDATLHAYWPPLAGMNYFRLDGEYLRHTGDWHDDGAAPTFCPV